MITNSIYVKEESEQYKRDLEAMDAFTRHIKKSLTEYYGIEAEVKLHRVQKNNGVSLSGVSLKREDKNASPTIYLEEFYKTYLDGIPYYEIVRRIIDIFEEHKEFGNFELGFFSDYEKVKKRLVMKLIHYDMNREMLKSVPHFRMLDLAGICYCIVMNDVMGNGTILINEDHLKEWNIDVKTLCEDAKRNMQRLFPVECKNMASVILEIMQKEYEKQEGDFNQDNFPFSIEDLREEDFSMYVLGNTRKLFGAASMLYDGVLEHIADQFNSSFFILPSSVHELIIVPDDGFIDDKALNYMVMDVNRTQLEQEEILSDHIYYYDKDKKDIQSLPLIPEKQCKAGNATKNN